MIWLTTQAQRRRPRGARIATATPRRRSLQRMVRKHEGRHGAHTRSTLSAHMHNNVVSTPAVAARQPVNHPQPQPQPRTLKLALDVHLVQHVVAMQYDGEFPKPPQRFSPAGLLAWVQKQLAQGWHVVSCYEAGPFGYGLHRQLTTLGVTNYVIHPRNWDDQHKRVKT